MKGEEEEEGEMDCDDCGVLKGRGGGRRETAREMKIGMDKKKYIVM